MTSPNHQTPESDVTKSPNSWKWRHQIIKLLKVTPPNHQIPESDVTKSPNSRNGFKPLHHRYSFWRIFVFENIVRKGEIARYEQFLLFPQCFLLNQLIVSPYVLIFLKLYLYVLLNLKSLKLAYQVKSFNSLGLLNFILLVGTMDLCCGAFRARSARTGFQPYYALHCPLFHHQFPSTKPILIPFNPKKSV